MTASAAARTAYHDELARRARVSGLATIVVAVLVTPAWAIFDRIVEPEQAHTFLILRLLCEIPMLVCLWLLWAHPLGRRRPNLLSFLVLAIVQSEVAWMVVRAVHARNAYLLGFSLALYGSGCISAGRARWSAAVITVTWVAFGAALLTAPGYYPAHALVSTVFYLCTASLIAMVSHVHRDRLTERELTARIELDREQEHTRQLLERLRRLSQEDPLTGLANRRRWDSELAGACAQARRRDVEATVVLIDLDRFKEINDRYGHASGDEALRAVAAMLLARVRGTDLVARVGGDELGVLLIDCQAAAAVEIAEQVRCDALELRPFEHVTLSLSLGVATMRGRDALPHDLMQRADEQLYRAKLTRNSVCATTARASAV